MPKKTAAITAVPISTAINNRHRSITSASAPAGSARRNIGRLAATWTSETMSGSGERSVISQPEAVVHIQVPILEMTVASHKTVKGA
jgi:hypothetical protein